MKADTDTGPSMRMFYEYLQCVGYDHEFYEKSVAKKADFDASKSFCRTNNKVQLLSCLPTLRKPTS